MFFIRVLRDKRKILERKSALILMPGHVVTRCSTDVLPSY